VCTQAEGKRKQFDRYWDRFSLLQCDVFNALSPGVLRHTKVTITFNIDVVDASDNLKEAIHSPVGAP